MEYLTTIDVQSRIDRTFPPNSQRHNEATMALNGLKASLERLASHGQALWLVDAPPFEGREYPMALYHATHGQSTVANRWEEDEARKAGWRRHASLEGRRPGPSGRPVGIFAAYHAAARPKAA